MPIRKSSKSDKSKKSESQQREQEQGEIPPVPKSPDDRPPTLESEGACGQSPTAEDSEHLEKSKYDNSGEEADGADSKQASGGRKVGLMEKIGLKKPKEKEKKKPDKKDRKDKGRKGNKQDEKEPQERTRSASQSKRRDKRTSQSSQHPPSLSEPPPTQRHHTHSESSQGSHVHANSQDTAIEEGAKQPSPETHGDDMQMETADVFVEPQSGQMTAQQDEKDRIIAELAKELEETKSTRIQKLEDEIQLLRTKETKMNTQHEEHMKDLHEAVQRKQDEIDKLSDKHATDVQAMKDDHSKVIADLHQERKQSEEEKDEEARKLKQSLQEQEMRNQESEEKIEFLRRQSVQLKEELETKLKEQKENEEELCAFPTNHHLEEIRKQKEELERKHTLEVNQLQAALKEKENLEEESRQEADKLRQELTAAKENHAKDVKLKQENVQDADMLRQELKDAEENHADEIRQLQAALKEKDEQEETKLLSKLDELATKHADEVHRLKAELKEKDEQCTKAIEDIKAEYEEKHKTEEHQKKTEVEAKIKRQDAVASGVLRGMKKEIETLSKNCEEKDATIAGLTKELGKVKEESQQKDLETEKHIEETKSEVEKLQREQRQHLAEVSKKQKEHDQQLEIKKKDIESLRKQLHQLSAKLEEEKETPEAMQRLTKELQEKDCELNAVVTEIRTLRGSYEKLVADHEHLQHQYKQLTVEVKMKKELSETSEVCSSSDPCDTTVKESQDQPVSYDGTTCNEEEKDFQSASETSFNEREEESTLSDMERMTLLQRAAAAEEGAKQAETHLRKLSEEKVALQDKLETMNKQFKKLEEWRKLMIDDAEQMPTSEATPDVSQEETVIVNRKKHRQLKSSFILLTEKNMKMERSLQQLLEKLEDRDNQIKELQLNARDDSIVPKVYESLSSEKVAESPEKLSHDEALKEIQKQKATISELKNCVASLQTKMGTFEKTAAENSKMEEHGKEQSKVVMEWRKKYEAAEKKVKEHEDELQVLRGEVDANRGQQKDSIDVQAVQTEYESQIKTLNSAISTLEIDSAELTVRYTTQEQTSEHLQQENQHLLQKLHELEREHSRLKAVYGTVTQQLSQLHKCQGEVDAMKKQAAAITEAMTAKTVEASDLKVEKDSLKTMLDEIAQELERRKIQAEIYKEDFENERKDREALANTYQDEKAAMSVQHQKIVDDLKQQIEELKIKVGLKEAMMKGECTKLEEQIQSLNEELRKVQEQSEQDKDALQIAVTEKQSLEEIHSKLEDKYQEKEAHLEKALAHKSELEDQLQKSRETMKGECAKLEVQIQTLNAELRKVQEQSEQDKDALQIALAEKQSLEEIHSKLDDKYQEKEAHLEKALAHKSDLEDQLQKSRINHERYISQKENQLQQLQSESTELHQQIARANEEIAAWRGDCQAKTQQVKQYSKQVDQFRAQVDGLTAGLRESRAKIAEYEHQFRFYQKQIKQLEEDNEQKDAVMKAKHEAEMLDVRSDLERLKGQKVMWEMTKQTGDLRGAASTCAEQLPSTVESRHPGVHPRGQQNVQVHGQGGDNVVRSHPQPNQYTSRDGAQDKSMTSPAIIAPGQQPFDNEFKSQQLVVSSGGIQQHYQHGYAGQGGMMVAPGQQNQYQQMQRNPQTWHGGHLGGGAAPDSSLRQAVHGHHRNQQNLNPQHGMGNTNGASIGMEQQQLGVVTQESGHQRVPSGPQENPLLQGINTEMHNVAAVVGREVDNNPELQSFSPQAPFDPNLICPMCRQQFRIGEIQKYRQHVQHCHGT